MTTRTHRRAPWAAALLLTIAPQAASSQTRPFTAADMLDIVQISGDVTVAPDGRRLAFVLPDLGDEWNVGERLQVGAVHVMDLPGGRPTPLIPDIARSSHPVFSPDGHRIALFLNEPAGPSLAVWDARDSRLRRLGTPLAGPATTAPQWATNERIVFERSAGPEPEPELARVQVLTITDPLPGDEYFRREARAGLAIVDVGTGSERTLVADGGGLLRFEASPDGRWVLATVAGRTGVLVWSTDAVSDPAVVGTASDRATWTAGSRLLLQRGQSLVTLPPDRPRTAPVPLIDFGALQVAQAVEAPDGQRFALLVPDPSITDPEIEAPQQGMYTIARPFMDLHLASVDGAPTTNVTADIPDQIGSPVWSPDGRSLYFVAVDNTTYEERLYRYDVRSQSRHLISEGRESFGTLLALPGGLLASIESATRPSDLWRFGPEGGDRTRVTTLNPQLGAFSFSRPELFYFDNQEGVRLGALLFRATGSGAGLEEPLITYVYEKLTPGIHRFQARQQIFATHGYAVLMPNVMIRVGEPGTSYVRSVVPATEAVHAMGFTNGRACMWGGSFGAYATSFVITQTPLFDCAVSRATPPELFRNWASGRDRDSENIERGQARMGGSPFEVMDRYLEQSAFFHLDKVETPVLITHGMKDYTILFEEGAMMFYALRRLGKEATFVAYREGDHSLYRHSRADALDVHERMLAWFARYMRPEG